MNVDIKKLHDALQEILDYVADVCEKNGLTYFLVYGTALGAHRHNGFIPWDDDIDIAMPRDDYEKFIEIMQKETDGSYELQNEDNEENYFLSFAKIRKNNTVFIESIAEDIYKNNGIYIDIFPLDYVKKPASFGYKLRKIWIKYLKHTLKVASCKELYKQKRNRLVYWFECVISIPAMIMPKNKLVKKLNRVMAGASTKEQATHIAQYDSDNAGLLMPYSYYFPAQKHLYEGKMYNIPNEIENYLRLNYGDTYMELPPKEKQQTHQPLKLVFDTTKE